MSNQRTIIIGGISGGIGSAIARKLDPEQYNIIGFAKTQKSLDSLSDLDHVQTHVVDATNSTELNDFAESVLDSSSSIDGYIHAIGSVFIKPPSSVTDDEWDAVLATNLSSAFYALRAFAKPMAKQKSGSLLFFSSCAASIGISNHEAIAAAKSGIDGLVISAASTYAINNVRVNAIAPGLVNSNATQSMLKGESSQAMSNAFHPIGRYGQPEDIAAVAEFLVSDKSSWVTGQIWGIDGGIASIKQKPKV